MKTYAHRFVLALLLIVPMASSARAADQGPSRLDKATQGPKALARLEVQPSRVDWLPNAEYESLILTVAGPGDFYLERELGPGQTPSFDLSEHRLTDGSYAYELRAVPRLDPTKPPKTGGASVQSGHLWIQGGSFVANVPPPPSKSAPLSPLQNLAPPDVVNPDDLVVQGQACIGASCVNGDADLGPVLILKESISGAPRQIRFDTPSCCFPSATKWTIQAADNSVPHGDFMIRTHSGMTAFRISSLAPENALTLFGNGNVGVGTLTPASRLHVTGGDVRVTGGSFIDDGVTLNAPDYVFEPDYKLMPLAELQAFIAREKHLPNVPSAREVKAQGVNLGQFQMRLLEKIEELTLYTLAQQSDLAALKGENSELRARLEALEQEPAENLANP